MRKSVYVAFLTVPVAVVLLMQAGCERESVQPDFGGVTGATIYR